MIKVTAQKGEFGLLRPYLNEGLYSEFEKDPGWSGYAASCLYSKIGGRYPLKGEMTLERLVAIDWMLKRKGSSLREMLAGEFKRLAEEYEMQGGSNGGYEPEPPKYREYGRCVGNY